MRRLFANYGLLTVALIGGFIAIGIFITVCFREENSLGSIINVWAGHLL